MRFDRRLARAQDELRKKGIGRQPPVMRGALEVHCTGGLSHMKGEVCLEHEDCVLHSTPLLAPIRRQIIFAWQEGMTSLDMLIG